MPTVRLSYKWVDEEGVEITTGVYQDVSDFAEVADYQAEWGETRAVIEPLSGAAITAGWVEIPMVVGAPTTPLAQSRVRTGATLSFRDSVGLPFATYIPAMRDSQFIGDVVNSETAEMVDLKAKATGAGDLKPWSSRSSGALMVAYIRGYMSNRKVKR
jgi:hypothetical protein